MQYHREGKIFIISALLDVTLWTILRIFFTHWIIDLLLIASALLLIFILHFFRNPRRPIPREDSNTLYAPADGKIVVVEIVEDHHQFNEAVYQVSIFMSPLNVHVNRTPLGGTIKSSTHFPGKYLIASHPKSSALNERQEVIVTTQDYRYLLVQIAGAVARRIACYIKAGDTVLQGQEFGFIRFGSRVDLFLPVSQTELAVKNGEKVLGNLTVIARKKLKMED